MGQIFTENVPSLVKASSTSVTLATTSQGKTTRVTVGGQQYVPTATLTLSTAASGLNGIDSGSVAANTLYYVYAVVTSAGVLGLVASTSSVNPAANAGYTATAANFEFKLVGQFSTDAIAAVYNVYATAYSNYADQFVQNMMINGNFDLWQRGTSVSLTASQYLADRFRVFHNGTYSGQLTASQDTDVPTQVQSGFQSRFSLKITKSTSAINPASADYAFISHAIEGQDYQQIHGARGARLQFWVKSSVAGVYSVGLTNSAESRCFVFDYTVIQANTWEKKTIDLVTDNTGTWLFDNGIGLRIGFNLANGSGNTQAPGSWTGNTSKYGSTNQTTSWSNTTAASTFWVSQIALLPGVFDPSSSIVHRRAGRTIGHEVQLCQRYFYSAVNPNDGGMPVAYGQAITTTVARTVNHWAVEMRAAPSLSAFSAAASSFRVSNTADNAVPTVSSFTLSASSTTKGLIDWTVGSGLTAGNAAKAASASGVLLGFDAEL